MTHRKGRQSNSIQKELSFRQKHAKGSIISYKNKEIKTRKHRSLSCARGG